MRFPNSTERDIRSTQTQFRPVLIHLSASFVYFLIFLYYTPRDSELDCAITTRALHLSDTMNMKRYAFDDINIGIPGQDGIEASKCI